MLFIIMYGSGPLTVRRPNQRSLNDDTFDRHCRAKRSGENQRAALRLLERKQAVSALFNYQEFWDVLGERTLTGKLLCNCTVSAGY